ncbi:hypothetical protein [Pelagicoccus sp. SDUM812002]|uniref:hypothetical protein n=1 Tax=Pelagicoccus sp. SDUM812002 TaxID=3041266 RepID=UPI00280D3D81|nr:hypothetical protein [Pelagicoccus sp. SDUM812002]MDQ8187407.1 hypothetical protein [Pelagicoccus sp. SDUM812002]
MREEETTTLPHEPTEADIEANQPKAGGFIEKTSSKIHDAKSQAGAAAIEFADKAKRRIADTSDAAKVKYTEVKEQASLKGAEAKVAVQSSFDKHPLAYVAGALVAGVAIGALLPRSRKESDMLASSGRKVRNTASSAVQETKEAAQAATDAATDTFKQHISE